MVEENLLEKYSVLYEVKQVFKLILQTFINEFKADSASLMLKNENNEFIIIEYIGLSIDTSLNIKFKEGEGIAGTCAKEKKTLIINNTIQDKYFKEFDFQRENIISNISYPIIINNEVVAIINISSSKPNRFNDNSAVFIKNYEPLIINAINTLKKSDKIPQLNFIDEVTNLYNVSYFYEAIEREVLRSLRYNEIFSLIMIKIDNFKEIIHNFEDEVIKHSLYCLGSLIKNTSRRVDICSSYKPDIFAIIVPETGRGGAEKKVERLLENIKEKRYLDYNKKIKNIFPEFKIKYSIASCPIDAKEVSKLINICNSQL